MATQVWRLQRGDWVARINRTDLSVYRDSDGSWQWVAEGRGVKAGQAATREEAMAAAEATVAV